MEAVCLVFIIIVTLPTLLIPGCRWPMPGLCVVVPLLRHLLLGMALSYAMGLITGSHARLLPRGAIPTWLTTVGMIGQNPFVSVAVTLATTM